MGTTDIGTFTVYSAIGNREDLSNVIYRIDPTEVPFLSGIEREKSSAVKHEWQTQALDAATSTNAAQEGADADTDAATPTVRLFNYTQISDKVARVSGTQRAVKTAGRDDELDYQALLKGLALKRDMETILLTNQAQSTGLYDSLGSVSNARKLGSILAWIYTNQTLATASVGATAPNGATIRIDASPQSCKAFTEASLKTVLQSIWTNGGKPDTIMAGGFNKQQFSLFTGRATQMEDTGTKKIIATVDAYESDFGKLKVIANRFQRTRDVLVLQMDMWALATLRNMAEVDLAKTGDSDRRQIITEYTLAARNEKASGGVFDVNSA
jgi:hypothetical protein